MGAGHIASPQRQIIVDRGPAVLHRAVCEAGPQPPVGHARRPARRSMPTIGTHEGNLKTAGFTPAFPCMNSHPDVPVFSAFARTQQSFRIRAPTARPRHRSFDTSSAASLRQRIRSELARRAPIPCSTPEQTRGRSETMPSVCERDSCGSVGGSTAVRRVTPAPPSPEPFAFAQRWVALDSPCTSHMDQVLIAALAAG